MDFNPILSIRTKTTKDGKKMKKLLAISTIAICTTTAANAGWLSNLFAPKEAEPQTLQEACDLEKIKSVCPEILLGQKTLTECLTDNVKTVSEKCVNYVKKSVSENNAEIAEFTNQIKAVAAEKAADSKLDSETAKQTLKNAVSEKVNTAKLELAKKLLADTTAE